VRSQEHTNYNYYQVRA